MIKECIEFNKKRNKFKYDSKLEVSMFKEEVQEFFEANTLAEKIDAYIDARYVHLGTVLKLGYNGLNTKDLPYDDSVIEIMLMTIQEDIPKRETLLKVISKAEQIVCDCNAMKISKLDKNGKVMKQKDLPNATELIEVMLEEELKED